MTKKDLADYEQVDIPEEGSPHEEVLESTETETTDLKDIPVFEGK